jgi:hypothetical protein
MTAIREVLADGVFSAVRQSPDLSAIRFERSLVRALGLRETRIALAVTLGDDVAEELIGRTSWMTELLVHAVTQDEEPDRLADQYLTLAHPLVMGYQHQRLNGITMLKIDRPLYANVGGASCVRTAYYRIEYQTPRDSLE